MLKFKLNKLREFAIELIIVFVGVYLAFQLNNYKEGVAEEELRLNLYKVMLNDFESNLKEIKTARKNIEELINNFNIDIEEGKRPKIEPIPVDLTNNLLLLRSIFNSGHLENLNPQYVSNISRGSNYITRASKILNQYNVSVTEMLIHHDFEQGAFYDDENQLKPKYQWLISDLEQIGLYVKSLEEAIEFGAIPGTKNLIEN